MKAKHRALFVVIFFALLSFIPLYGNKFTQDSGILENAILIDDDPYVLLDKKAEELQKYGLKTGDVVPFVISFPNGMTKEDLIYVLWLSEQVKREFPEVGILSLANIPKYKDTGTELLNNPYITREMLTSPSFDIEKWKKAIKNDSSVYGTLIGRNFDYTLITLMLSRDSNEVEIFRRSADFLEQRKINRLEWFLKTDIKPVGLFRNVTIAGWAEARGLMSAALMSDVLRLTVFGIIVVSMAFLLSFLSVRQAIISTLYFILVGALVRGTIGLLQLAGIMVYERVYILLVYTPLIVAGISFAGRKFEAYNELRQNFPGLSRAEIWKRSKSVNRIIFTVALVSILNFLTLYQIGTRGIMEVGILTAIGLVYLLALAFWLIPAVHTIVGGEANIAENRLSRLGQKWNSLLGYIAASCYKITKVEIAREKRKAIVAIAITMLLLVVAASAIISDYYPSERKVKKLEIRTKPLEYIPGTIAYHASEILNKTSNYGFDRIPIVVSPRDKSKNIYNTSFIDRVNKLQKDIKKIEGTREATSVIDIIKVISQESYRLALPNTEQQIRDTLQMIETDLGTKIKEQFWCDNGLVIFSSLSADDSNIMSSYINDIRYLENEYKDLEIIPFGKLVLYPQVDKYIREGKPWNLFSSQCIVIIICTIWIWWRSQKHQSNLSLVGWRAALAISLPFAFATAVIALVMIFFRIPLDQATACITALAINASIDFSLYLIADYQKVLNEGGSQDNALKYALGQKGRVILIDIFLNSLCFMPLIISNFIPVSRLGWIMVVMLIACGVGSLILLPMVLPLCISNKHRQSMQLYGNSTSASSPIRVDL